MVRCIVPMAGWIALLGVLVGSFPSHADPTVTGWTKNADLQDVVKKMAAYCKAHFKGGQPELATPEVVRGDPSLPGGSELGIKLAIATLLKQEGLEVQRTGQVLIKVSYLRGKAPKRGNLDGEDPCIRFTFTLQVEGKDLPNVFPATVRDPHLISQIAGKSGVLVLAEVKGQAASNHEFHVAELLDKPSSAVRVGSTVRAARDGKTSVYAVEIVSNGKSLEPEIQKGEAVVKFQRNTTFTLRLHNHSKHEAVANVKIDGIDICDYPVAPGERPREPLPCAPLWVVPAGKVIEIKGWCRDLEKTEEFRVVERENSVLARVNYNDQLEHAICVTFSASWKEGDPIPDDEPAPNKGGIGIGIGDVIPDEKKVVPRKYGSVRDIVVVRYQAAQP